MHYYSENIKRIRHLLTYPKPFEHRAKIEGFSSLLHNQVLAIMLANADIATPVLNKETVTKLFSGECGWPKKNGEELTIKQGVDVTHLEYLGLVSFYANYCVTHRGYIHRAVEPHESLSPILSALDLIADIQHGESTINPHFRIKKSQARQLLQDNQLSIELDNIDELHACDDDYHIYLPDSGHDGSLAELLWQEIFSANNVSNEDKKSRFKKWVLICNVYYWRYLSNIDIDHLHASDRSLFAELALNFIEADVELQKPRKRLENQWACEASFESLHQKTNASTSILINLSSEGRQEKSTYTVTPNSLGDMREILKSRTSYNSDSGLELINHKSYPQQDYHPHNHHRYFNFPLNIVKESISIDGHGTFNRHERVNK